MPSRTSPEEGGGVHLSSFTGYANAATPRIPPNPTTPRSLFNNIVQPSQLPVGADMHLFRDGIAPKWEDAAFKHGDEQRGGKWTVIVKDRRLLDEHWLSCLLALVGEQFADPEEIAGVVVSVRGKQAKLCLWTRTETNQAVQTKIAMQLKSVLDLGENERLTYQSFKDEMDGERRDLYIV